MPLRPLSLRALCLGPPPAPGHCGFSSVSNTVSNSVSNTATKKVPRQPACFVKERSSPQDCPPIAALPAPLCALAPFNVITVEIRLDKFVQIL